MCNYNYTLYRVFSWDINLLYSTLFSIILHVFKHKEKLSIIQATFIYVSSFTVKRTTSKILANSLTTGLHEDFVS